MFFYKEIWSMVPYDEMKAFIKQLKSCSYSIHNCFPIYFLASEGFTGKRFRSPVVECGVENIFMESDVFGPRVVQSVMSGSNYICGKKGMMILAETLQLQFQQYNQKHPISKVDFDNIKHYQSILSNNSPMKVTTGIYMKTICENSSINMKLSRNISEKRVHSLLVGMFY